MSYVSLQGLLKENARLQRQISRLQGDISRLQGRLNGEGGQKRLLILFVVLLALLLFGRTFASTIINGWLKSNGNAEANN
jgi:hypothetical protein